MVVGKRRPLAAGLLKTPAPPEAVTDPETELEVAEPSQEAEPSVIEPRPVENPWAPSPHTQLAERRPEPVLETHSELGSQSARAERLAEATHSGRTP